jgi:hypothetical protein
MIYTDYAEAGVRVLVSRKKWAEAKRLLAALHGLAMASEWVDHKVLARISGVLVYVARSYRPLTPFIMGWCMSIDGWRSGRDEEGWRLREAEVNANRDSEDESEPEEPLDRRNLQPPVRVKDVPRLMVDLEVRWMLTAAEHPPLRRVRAQSKVDIIYCYGDASGSGFGWCIDFGYGVRYY